MVNCLPELFGRGEACALQGVSRQKGKPHLHLIHPACVRGDVMEMNILVPREPHVSLRLMRAEVVRNYMDFPVWMGAYYAVHEVQELYPSSPLVVSSYDLTGGRFECSEKGGGAVSLVFVREAGQCPTVGQLQIPLSTLQGLDVGLLIYAKYQRILRRVKIQRYDVCRLFGKLRIGAYTPASPPLKLDAMTAQYLPYKIGRKRQCLGQQSPIPLGVSGWWCLIKHLQHAPLVIGQVSSPLSGARGISQPVQSQPGKTRAPLGHRGRTRLKLSGNGVRSHTFVGHQDNLGTEHQPLLRSSGASPRFQNSSLLGFQCYRSGLITHDHSLPHYS